MESLDFLVVGFFGKILDMIGGLYYLLFWYSLLYSALNAF